MAGNVAHDGRVIGPCQALAGNFAKQRAHRFGRLCLRDRYGVAVFHIELGKGVLRQPQFVAADDGGVIHHIHGGQDVAPVGAHLYLGQRLKTLGPVHRAIAVQVSHVFAPGVDGHTAQGQS